MFDYMNGLKLLKGLYIEIEGETDDIDEALTAEPFVSMSID